MNRYTLVIRDEIVDTFADEADAEDAFRDLRCPSCCRGHAISIDAPCCGIEAA